MTPIGEFAKFLVRQAQLVDDSSPKCLNEPSIVSRFKDYTYSIMISGHSLRTNSNSSGASKELM